MIEKLKAQMQEYFVGKEDIIENLLVCLFAGGHVLLEDVPGVGKTTLAQTVAKSVDCDFGRIQFTPDTLPSDVVGTEIYNMKTGEFTFREGAIMHQIVLADEINRTSPKTQASLLEAMAEQQVTVGGVKRSVPQPFMVIATQNPVEFMGTYPLPEAQLDRFMMKLSLGYPSAEEELRLTRNVLNGKKTETLESVIRSQDVLNIRSRVEKITIRDNVLSYLREIIDQTRQDKRFVYGASPRALLALMRAAQARAFLLGREFVKPDDIKALVLPVLAHRLMLTSEAKIGKEETGRILKSIVARVKVPVE